MSEFFYSELYEIEKSIAHHESSIKFNESLTDEAKNVIRKLKKRRLELIYGIEEDSTFKHGNSLYITVFRTMYNRDLTILFYGYRLDKDGNRDGYFRPFKLKELVNNN